eukprot:7038160-Pyramimonas_sp.AAC.1
MRWGVVSVPSCKSVIRILFCKRLVERHAGARSGWPIEAFSAQAAAYSHRQREAVVREAAS